MSNLDRVPTRDEPRCKEHPMFAAYKQTEMCFSCLDQYFNKPQALCHLDRKEYKDSLCEACYEIQDPFEKDRRKYRENGLEARRIACQNECDIMGYKVEISKITNDQYTNKLIGLVESKSKTILQLEEECYKWRVKFNLEQIKRLEDAVRRKTLCIIDPKATPPKVNRYEEVLRRTHQKFDEAPKKCVLHWKSNSVDNHGHCIVCVRQIYDYGICLVYEHYRCDVCNKPIKSGTGKCAIDHCHECDEVRGVLCSSCNSEIEKRRDKCMWNIIRPCALDYVVRHSHGKPTLQAEDPELVTKYYENILNPVKHRAWKPESVRCKGE